MKARKTIKDEIRGFERYINQAITEYTKQYPGLSVNEIKAAIEFIAAKVRYDATKFYDPKPVDSKAGDSKSNEPQSDGSEYQLQVINMMREMVTKKNTKVEGLYTGAQELVGFLAGIGVEGLIKNPHLKYLKYEPDKIESLKDLFKTVTKEAINKICSYEETRIISHKKTSKEVTFPPFVEVFTKRENKETVLITSPLKRPREEILEEQNLGKEEAKTEVQEELDSTEKSPNPSPQKASLSDSPSPKKFRLKLGK